MVNLATCFALAFFEVFFREGVLTPSSFPTALIVTCDCDILLQFKIVCWLKQLDSVEKLASKNEGDEA